MSEPLALKYRPRTFDAVVGQKSVEVILRAMVAKDAVPHALLFDGCRGTGKTTSARILAAALNCEIQPGPCTTCPSCKAIYDGTSLDVHEVDAASNGGVAEIRSLVEQVMYSVGGRKRVVLLDEAHSMSREAFNALLKTLEEPPPNTVFVLLTTEPSKILDTIVSRCMKFTFRRISVADILGRLEYIASQEDIKADRDLLVAIAERADGGMRDAVMTLDQVGRVGIRTADDFAELMGESDFAPALVAAMANGDLPASFGLLEDQMLSTGDADSVVDGVVRCLRDVLVLRAGQDIARQGVSLDARKSLAQRMDPDRVLLALRALWELKTRVRAGGDARAMMDLAVVVISEALCGARAVPQSAPAAMSAPPRRLTIEEMMKLGAG